MVSKNKLSVLFLLGWAGLSWAQKSPPPFEDLPVDEPVLTDEKGSDPKPVTKKESSAKKEEKSSDPVTEEEVDAEDEEIVDSETAKDSKETPVTTSSEPQEEKSIDPKNTERSKPNEEVVDTSPLPQTQSGMSVTEEPLPESEEDPTLSPVVNEKDFQSADAEDIKEVERKFEQEVMPRALIDPQDDPGAALPLDEKFYRVPLRPRMSDASWRRWAGPGLTKIYKIRRKDSLWAVSERLFGTPYLWPKVWHLNAHLSNPNIIEPGIELQFNPGNPNSAPTLALLSQGQKTGEPMPLLIQNRPLTLYEKLEQTLAYQVLGKNPPFKNFLIYEKPKPVGKVPDPRDKGHMLWEEGDDFPTQAPEGNYIVIRYKEATGESVYGHRVQWVGNISVQKKQATIEKIFTEIEEGDVLVDRNFQIAPSAIHEDRLEDLASKVRLVQVQDEARSMIAENNLVGVVFPSTQTGPQAGSLLNIEKNKKKVGTLLIIDRDQRMATGWVVDSTEEFDYSSRLQ